MTSQGTGVSSLLRRSSDSNLPKKKDCLTFEPQQWRKNVCRNCFRTKAEHPVPGSGTPSTLSSSVSGESGGGNASPKTSPLPTNKGNGKEGRKSESPTGRRSFTGCKDDKQTTASPRESKKISGNSGSRTPRKSSSPTASRNTDDSKTSSALRSSGAHGHLSSTSSIDARYVEELENDFFDLEDKHDALLKEKVDLEGELETKGRQFDELQETLENYREKVNALERRCAHLEEEIKNYRERLKLPESDRGLGLPGVTSQDAHRNEELRRRLDEVEQLCQEVMEENEVLKEEVEEMQREIEEMHDHFQEDDTDTLRELQRDLEAANKNCRIFQFKLRKAERRYEQCENERAAVEEKLSRLEHEVYSEGDMAHIRGLEEELRVAKEVSVRLNSELDLTDEKRSYFEEENRHLKEDLQNSETRRIAAENDLGRLRLEMDKLKIEAGIYDTGPLQVTDRNQTRSRLTPNTSLSREPSFEEHQLQRELDATKERETDLVEQLRFAEEEVKKLKRRLNDVQDENDALTKKLERLVLTQSATGGLIKQSENGDSDSDMDVEDVHAMRIQLELLDQENAALRKKVVTADRENITLQSDVRRLQTKLSTGSGQDSSSDSRGSSTSTLGKSQYLDQSEAAESERQKEEATVLREKLSRIQSDNERLERENRRLTILNQIPQGQQPVSTKSKQGRSAGKSSSVKKPLSDTETLRKSNESLKEKLKDFDIRLKDVSRDVSIMCGTSEDREREWFDKYNDALETSKEQELQIIRLKKRIAELQEENESIKVAQKKATVSEKRHRESTKLDLKKASREVLLEEINCLEEEVDEVCTELTTAKQQVTNLRSDLTKCDDTTEEMRVDFEKRERELLDYIVQLENKNMLVSNLLDIVQERANDLQDELDRYLGIESDTSAKDNTSATSTASAVSAASTGSDEVFDEQNANTLATCETNERLRTRARCLERLLAEERQRTRVAEKQLELVLKDSPRSKVSADSQLKTKEIELLKKEIQEKDETIEERDNQIKDIKSRLDQARKMNDAMKVLIDKEPRSEAASGDNKKSERGKHQEAQDHSIEIASYKKEIDGLRKDVQQYNLKLSESEKIRERMHKEIKNLQEELKLREDSIFEQDDDLEKKNNEIRSMKRSMEECQRELNRLHTEAKSKSQQSESNKSQAEEIARLNEEIQRVSQSLTEAQSRLEERSLELGEVEEKVRILSDSVRHRDERIREKDDLIQHISGRLQNRERELTDLDNMLRQTTDKLNVTEEEVKAVRLRVTEQDREVKTLSNKMEELTANLDRQSTENATIREENQRLKLEADSARAQQGGQSSSEKTSGSHDEALFASRAEVDKLKKELGSVKREKDEAFNQWRREKGVLERKLADQGRKTSLDAEKSGDSYTRAIQAQQVATKLNLLNDHIARLNRSNIELKLQNEALQNDVLDYQRKFRSLKGQYETEQEAWVSERVLLESRAKEHEDRKMIIASTRKSLQETSLKLADAETKMELMKQELAAVKATFEKEKFELTSKLGQYDEQQKLPKVLQRFGGGGGRAGGSSGGLASATSSDRERKELQIRMESLEKTIARLRAELGEKETGWGEERARLIRTVDATRAALEKDLETAREEVLKLEGCQQQAEMSRERLLTIEEAVDREQKIWIEERLQLQFRAEEARLMVEQWIGKLQIREDAEGTAPEAVTEILKDMEKFKNSREKAPYSHMRRRPSEEVIVDFRYLMSPAPDGSSLSPTQGYISPLSKPPLAPLSHQMGLRSTSMDWSQRIRHAGGTVGAAEHSSSTLSLTRCNRSVSPDVTVRKVSNYPDPTPGFLLRPGSRQSSNDSLSSTTDYSQRSFTVPGRPSNQLRHSPARQKFFEDLDTKVEEVSQQSPISLDNPPAAKKESTSSSAALLGKSDTDGRKISASSSASAVTEKPSTSAAVVTAKPPTSSAAVTEKSSTSAAVVTAKPPTSPAAVTEKPPTTAEDPLTTSATSEEKSAATKLAPVPTGRRDSNSGQASKPAFGSLSIGPSIQQLRQKFSPKTSSADTRTKK